MLLLLLLLALPRHHRVKPAEREHAFNESRTHPLPKEEGTRVNGVFLKAVVHKIRHLGGVDADHAEEEIGLNGPGEGGEA